MKKLLFLLLIVGTFSCNSEEEMSKEPVLTHTIIIDGRTFNIWMGSDGHEYMGPHDSKPRHGFPVISYPGCAKCQNKQP